MDPTTFTINIDNASPIQISIGVEADSLAVLIDGYEGAEPGGAVMSIRKTDQGVVVEVRAEILCDDPTHLISLENARVARRNSEVIDILRQLRNDAPDPLQEGMLIYRLTQHINSTTGKRFNLKTIAELIGQRYSHVRNRFSLVLPHGQSSRRLKPLDHEDLSSHTHIQGEKDDNSNQNGDSERGSRGSTKGVE